MRTESTLYLVVEGDETETFNTALKTVAIYTDEEMAKASADSIIGRLIFRMRPEALARFLSGVYK